MKLTKNEEINIAFKTILKNYFMTRDVIITSCLLLFHVLVAEIESFISSFIYNLFICHWNAYTKF